ncbi:MAG: RsmB/NOP family class I SAM-dependent RNA methyltransferase [Candidatus Sumerlaeia bacterium]|nr:RsmB/NOP family class I SAM-dependent RNA methyltransferase [Candidatus Sumerlaeia bacterium]
MEEKKRKPPMKGKPRGDRPGGPKKDNNRPRRPDQERSQRPQRTDRPSRKDDRPPRTDRPTTDKPRGMNRRALLQLSAELLHEFRCGDGPADRAVGDYFHKRKFLGSADRTFIGDAFFQTLRHLRRYDEAIFSSFSGQFVARARASVGFPVTQPIGARSWQAGQRSAPEGKKPQWLSSDRVIDTLRVGIAAVEAGIVPVEDLTAELLRAWPQPNSNRPGSEEIPEQPVEEKPASKSPIKPIQSASVERMCARSLELAGTYSQPGKSMDSARRHSFPDWLWAQIGVGRDLDQCESLAASLALPAPITLRVNTLRVTLNEARAGLIKAGIKAIPGTHTPDALVLRERVPRLSLPGIREGWFEFQDEGSQLIGVYTGVEPGMTVVDACAGGGGKTLHLAALMANEGKILPVDVDEARVKDLHRRAKRAGVRIMDEPRLLNPGDPIPTDIPPADLVLIDAPCSGTGTIRRSPDRRWRLSSHELEIYRQAQSRLLDQWAVRIRPGGALVYSTCSLLHVENSHQISEFLQRHPEFTIAPPAGFPGPLSDKGELITTPDQHGCDGFYAARLVRSGD